ncbi:hypothetical protein D3C72_2040120 [compost metagenome]
MSRFPVTTRWRTVSKALRLASASSRCAASTINTAACALLTESTISCGDKRAFKATLTSPALYRAHSSSMISGQFQAWMATRSPLTRPIPSSALASRLERVSN